MTFAIRKASGVEDWPQKRGFGYCLARVEIGDLLLAKIALSLCSSGTCLILPCLVCLLLILIERFVDQRTSPRSVKVARDELIHTVIMRNRWQAPVSLVSRSHWADGWYRLLLPWLANLVIVYILNLELISSFDLLFCPIQVSIALGTYDWIRTRSRSNLYRDLTVCINRFLLVFLY